MIPLQAKILNSLFQPLTMNNILSQGRTTKLAWRIRLTKEFFSMILDYNKNHGSSATVKLLKASLVALQKSLGKDKLVSLQVLGASAHLSKTAAGLPRFIPYSERVRIRSGDVRTIRFWTGLLNLYRIIKVPGELKLSTITAPFSGDVQEFEKLLKDLELPTGGLPLFFNLLPGFQKIRAADLSPKDFVLSRSASPSNKKAASGILTDIWLMNKRNPELWQEILYYLHSVNPKVSGFIRALQDGYQLVTRLEALESSGVGVKTGNKWYQDDRLMLKDSLRSHGIGKGDGLSQFAIKEEAAGKIRLFALMDSVTQSVMKPLHVAMFALLRLIPNDGTFDQEESVRRGMAKSLKAGKAFSFDLTAATDRLPVSLTAILIELIFNKSGLGESWKNVMTMRDFVFNDKVADKLKIPLISRVVRYAVGQPMGALSSWAGLAITHHWIVQVAAYRATGKLEWNTEYEILGDDLVIFNSLIAEEYLKIMKILGCEINLDKSINAPNVPVFEFAKRTVLNGHIVSGVSMVQLRAGWNVAGRVANCLQFANSGLITKPSLLAIALSRYAFSNGKMASNPVNFGSRAKRLFSLGLLSIFGVFYQQGKMPLKLLMQALANPHYEDADYSGEAIDLPPKASLNVAFKLLSDGVVPDDPFSNMEQRSEVYKEYADELVDTMLQKALQKARVLYENSEELVQRFAQSLYFGEIYENGKRVPLSDLPSTHVELYIQIENFTNWMLGLEHTSTDPETLYDELYKVTYDNAKWHRLSYEDAQRWLERIEALEFRLTLADPAPPGKTILESAPILGVLRNMDPTRKVRVTYFQAPAFNSLYAIEEIGSLA